MADFQQAIQITLQNEGGFFHNPTTGEIVNHGITLKFVINSGYKPDADEAFIRNLTVAEASRIYQKYFWDAYHIGQIIDQDLANKVFDLTVNMGPAVLQVLQSAVNACGGHCAVDGIIGPASIAAINALDPATLLSKFRSLAAQSYRDIAVEKPELAGNLNGWLARLDS